MESSQCSLLFVHPDATETTFHKGDTDKVDRFFEQSSTKIASRRAQHLELRESILTFLSVFVEVVMVPCSTAALRKLKYRSRVQSPPTIVLVDIDLDPLCQNASSVGMSSSTVTSTLPGNNSNTTITISPSSPNALHAAHAASSKFLPLELVQIIADELSQGSLDKVVPLVSCSLDDPALMLQCINKGAEDFIIKPITVSKAKTMFLNLHRQLRRRGDVLIPPAADNIHKFDMSVRLDKSKLQPTSPLKDRLHEVFVQDKMLSDFMIDFYTPSQPPLQLASSPGLDAASSQERIKYLKERLTTWEFAPSDFSQEDSLRCVCLIFDNLLEQEEFDQYNFSKEQVHSFLLSIRQSYHATNPYHNFTHALDVLQAIHIFLCSMGVIPHFTKSGKSGKKGPRSSLARFLRPLDIFALMIAAIGHDVGHPGVNNLFMVNTCTPLAQVYNDRSVLESFHCMALFQLLKKHGFEDYSKYPCLQPHQSDFRKVIINTILATDMSLHFDFMDKMKSSGHHLADESSDVSVKQMGEDRILVCSALIKCADISNAARPFSVAEGWANVLLKEWANQGILEKELGIPISPGNDPETTSKPVSQITFIDAFVKPLFEFVSQLIPSMSFTVDNINYNRGIWEQRLLAEKALVEGPNGGATSDEHGGGGLLIGIATPAETISGRRLSQLGHNRRFSVPFISADGTPVPVTLSVQVPDELAVKDDRATQSLSSSPRHHGTNDGFLGEVPSYPQRTSSLHSFHPPRTGSVSTPALPTTATLTTAGGYADAEVLTSSGRTNHKSSNGSISVTRTSTMTTSSAGAPYLKNEALRRSCSADHEFDERDDRVAESPRQVHTFGSHWQQSTSPRQVSDSDHVLRNGRHAQDPTMEMPNGSYEDEGMDEVGMLAGTWACVESQRRRRSLPTRSLVDEVQSP